MPRANKPKFDNRRTRFLSHEEADQLLQELKLKSQDVHDMTLLSLHCGLRAGEIFGLIWGDVDGLALNDGIIDRKQKLTFHSCRHTCASWLAQAGVSLFIIKEILGHVNN